MSKRTWAAACALCVSVACGSDKVGPGATSPSDGGAASVAGAAGSVAAAGSAGARMSDSQAGAAVSGNAGNGEPGGSLNAGRGGSGGGGGTGSSAAGNGGALTSGAGGGAGGGAGSAAMAFKCPAGPYQTLSVPTAKATRIPGAPPSDGYNAAYGNVEGPLWVGDSLYFTEQKDGDIPPARILKLAPNGTVSVLVPESGSNGLAVDSSGTVFAAVHKDGSISTVDLKSGVMTPLITKYNGIRFSSPNDLAIRSDGTIYFSDPKYQNKSNPQMGERLYWVTPAPTRTVTAITGAPSTPNGVTLSPDEKTLYVSGSQLKQFTVMPDGSLTGAMNVPNGSGGDGMVVDCAGNLYVTSNGHVQVFLASGGSPKTIDIDGGGATPTNVAFGGNDHQTLYVTAMGNLGQRGVFSIHLNVPGYPF